jgi:membrane protease YdiL (CAAX protease family)
MLNIDKSAGAASSDGTASARLPADRRPWGVWASLACYVLIFEVEGRVYDAVLEATGLQQILDHNTLLHALNNIVGWGINLLIIVLAVRLTRIPLREYLGWNRPRARDVVLGIAVILALYGAFVLFLLSIGQAAPAVHEYRAVVAAGTSPWWFVLQWWPAIFLASFVEESFFRGFLWRGVQFRFDNWAAFLLTTVLFAAMHYNYWMPDGVVDPASVVQYLVVSSILGALRWRSGGTTVPIIAHALDNAGLKIAVVVLSVFFP